MSNHFGDELNVDSLLSTGRIPIIDLAENTVAAQLKKALSEKGILFLVNHGISDENIHTAWSYFNAFCNLPDKVKNIYVRQEGSIHGYLKPNSERFYSSEGPELRHAFNLCQFQKEKLPADPLFGFYDHVSNLAEEFKKVALLLLHELAISMDLEPNFFHTNHSQMLSGNDDNGTTLRLLYYPPIDQDAKTTRCGAHCDYGTFTLLTQDSEGGLEAKLPGSDLWQRVGHLPGALLMNCGEIMSLWTEQRYPAVWHRVIAPLQPSIRGLGRNSMAFFCHPEGCTSVAPLKQTDATNEQGSELLVTANSHVEQRLRDSFAHQRK